MNQEIIDEISEEIQVELPNVDDDGSLNEESKSEIKKYDISSYPADYTLTTILEKYNKSIIVPEFQRRYVWGNDSIKQSRLIESLLLGLPVPQIFLFQKKDDKNLLLIDGFQRLHTVHRFYNNEFPLEGIQEEWVNKRYADLSSEDRELLDNTTIRAIIIRQIAPNDNYTSMYQIFERLNTGGMFLSPMEIRKAIFYGDFYKNLELANQDENWKKIINRKQAEIRLRDVEWILRIISFFKDGYDKYQDPMKDYLTTFMSKNKEYTEEGVFKSFKNVCKLIVENLGPKPFHIISGRLNLAVLDSVLYAMMKNETVENLKTKFSELLVNEKYLTIIKSRDATRTLNVKDRLKLAEEIIK